MNPEYQISQYTRFGNYYLALQQIADRALRAAFSLAIDEFMFEGIVPEWEDRQLDFLWQMIEPSLKTSLRLKFNGEKAKGKGTGPRPSMQGNQNAKKQTDETQKKNLTTQDFIDAWKEASENKQIVMINDHNLDLLRKAWPEIKSLATFKSIVKSASRDNLFEGCSDYFNYLFNKECRYRKYLLKNKG